MKSKHELQTYCFRTWGTSKNYQTLWYWEFLRTLVSRIWKSRSDYQEIELCYVGLWWIANTDNVANNDPMILQIFPCKVQINV